MSFETLPDHPAIEKHGADLIFDSIIKYREAHGLTIPRPEPDIQAAPDVDFVVGQDEEQI